MTVRYAIAHVTEYHYAVPVAVSHNEARVRLRTLPYQKVVEQRVEIDPAANTHSRFLDHHGNEVDYFELHEPVDVLRLTSTSVVERSSPAPTAAGTVPWNQVAVDRGRVATEFRLDSPLVAASESFRAYAAVSFPRGRPLVEAVAELTHRIHAEFAFDTTATNVHTPVHEVLTSRAGVCQDFAHVEIACLRSLGLSARYVSGYLRTVPPPGEERLVGADATHAWIAVLCGGDEWLEFDPTNDVVPDVDHVTVGWGRDYHDVAPLQGVLVGGGEASLRVSVDVSVP